MIKYMLTKLLNVLAFVSTVFVLFDIIDVIGGDSTCVDCIRVVSIHID
jgi:hypothetical protein